MNALQNFLRLQMAIFLWSYGLLSPSTLAIKACPCSALAPPLASLHGLSMSGEGIGRARHPATQATWPTKSLKANEMSIVYLKWCSRHSKRVASSA